MNQILSIRIVNKKKLKYLRIQLIISVLAFLFFISTYLFYVFKLKKEEKLSKNFSDSYGIYKLYSEKNVKKNFSDTDILGTIIIPKLEMEYPFFYGCNDNLLKIAPCRFYGEMPFAKGNLCISGHNYDDNRFFGQINNLINGDTIIIEDTFKNRFFYEVFDKYEVISTDLSPIEIYNKNNYTLTLITCNNINKKRLIVKATLKAYE